MNIEYELIRSDRKTISIEITKDARVIVRAPKKLAKSKIEEFIHKKENWINEKLELMRSKMSEEDNNKPKEKSEAELYWLKEKAKLVIPPKVAYYARIIGVTYGSITIRNQKTRWGSCSSKGNLNFNLNLIGMPEKIIDYVIVHELCHRLEMNHSDRFWKHVEKYIPDYKERREWLKKNGNSYM